MDLNTKYKCFDTSPLPSMELDLYKEGETNYFINLINTLFIKNIKGDYSDYCS